MGVHGLTSYIEKDRRFLINVHLQATRLVIDGSSLYFSLYFSCGADQQCGGEYEAFAAQVRKFFTVLFICKIQPFVVLDGGVDPSDKKFATLRQRLQSSIQEAHSLSRGLRGSVLPRLTKAVFMQLLSEMAVPFAQCPAEADMEIASLAHQWGCPVLTNDSDFYIFELRGGYIPFRYFQWVGVPVDKRPHPSQCFIPARCFTVQCLCSHFQGLSPKMLPLFAVIMGNDYTPDNIKNIFFSRVELPVVPGGRGRGNPQIEGLLLWLAQFSHPAEALEEVLRLELEGGRGGQRGSSIRSIFSVGMQNYALPPRSSLAQFFSGGLTTLPGSMEMSEALAAQPQWLLRGIVTGRLPSVVQDVLVLQRVMLIPQVENSRLPSSHCTSLPIRQVIYGLLLLKRQQAVTSGRGRGGPGGRGKSGSGQRGQSRAESCAQSLPTVVEYDRHDLNLTKSTINPVLPTGARVQLETMDQAPVSVRLQVLLSVLLTEEHALANLPSNLKLPVCVTAFWQQHCKPRPDPAVLQALILGLIFGELNYSRTMTADPKSSRPGVAAVLHRLDQLRVQRVERRGLNVEVAHALSQWQSCMWAALGLNQLLCCPLPEPPCAWLFSGTLLHAVQAALRQGAAVGALLAGDPYPGQLFSSLMEATRPPAGPGPLGPPASSSGPRRKGRGAMNPQAHARGQGPRGRGQRGGQLFSSLMEATRPPAGPGPLGPPASSSSGPRRKGRGAMNPQAHARGQGPRGRGQRGNHRGLNNRFAMLMSDEDGDDE